MNDKKIDTLPEIPGASDESSSAGVVLESSGGAPEQLGFDLRFEAGKALLALEDRSFNEAVRIKRALFEVPDVNFPLDVTGGAERFQDKRLTLRAVELELKHDALFDEALLRDQGLTLERERTRSGGVEVIVGVKGLNGELPIRARGIFVAAGDAGIAVVLHEVIAFGDSPRDRIDLSEAILNALSIPGGSKAKGMVLKASPFRAVFAQLLPAFGWKIPALGDVRVHEAVLGRGLTTIRAWSGERPSGWKKARSGRQGPLRDAVALASFAESMPKDRAQLMSAMDHLVDGDAVPAAMVPFIFDIYRGDERRRAEGRDLVKRAFSQDPEHLGVLSAYASAALSDDETIARLCLLGESADQKDEPWVSSRAFESAAERALLLGDIDRARACAESAWKADPTYGEAGVILVKLTLMQDDHARALDIGRAAFDRLDPDAADALAVSLAKSAHIVEGAAGARTLLRRALRRGDRRDALFALVRLEVDASELDRAAEVLARLLVQPSGDDVEDAEVQSLAASLSEARGDDNVARMHWTRALELQPENASYAIALAKVLRRGDALDRAISVLNTVCEFEEPSAYALLELCECLIEKGGEPSGNRVLQLLERLREEQGAERTKRLRAEADALLGNVDDLARILEAEGEAGDFAALGRSARLFLRAGKEQDAARVLSEALKQRPEINVNVSETLEALKNESPDLAVSFVAALENDIARFDDEGTARRDLAELIAERQMPALARVLLTDLDSEDAIARRASLSAEAGDVTFEIADRRALIAKRGEGAPANVAEHLHLARLHIQPLGAGAKAAAESYHRAHRLGTSKVEPWLEAALQSDDHEEIANVLRLEKAPLEKVPLSKRQALVHEDDVLNDPADTFVRLRVLETICEESDRNIDRDAYLALVKAVKAPDVAADILEANAIKTDSPRWLLEAYQLDRAQGENALAYARLKKAIGTPLQNDRAILATLFDAAIEAEDETTTFDIATLLLSLTDDEAASVEIHRRRTEAMRSDKKKFEATSLWLDLAPFDDRALQPFVLLALEAHEKGSEGEPVAEALLRLEARVQEKGENNQLEDFALMLADAFRTAKRIDEEARALECAVTLDDDHARPDVQRRLGDIFRESDPMRGLLAYRAAADGYRLASKEGEEVDALKSVVTLSKTIDEREEWERALNDWVSINETSDEASKARLEFLSLAGRDSSLADEYQRRTTFLDNTEAQSAAFLSLGDLFHDALEKPQAAERAWLHALRLSYSEAVLRRLHDHASGNRRARLLVRSHLAAARSVQGLSQRSRHLSESASLLAGVTQHPRLAISLYRMALEGSQDSVAIHHALCELYRSENRIEEALDSIDAVIALSTDTTRALALEAKADIFQRLKDDPDQAAVLRREALALAPNLRLSALALEQYLLEKDEIHESIEVRARLSEASESDDVRGQTYAHLAERAETLGNDPRLAIDLAQRSLSLLPNLDPVRRLRAEALYKLGKSENNNEYFEQSCFEFDSLFNRTTDESERSVYIRRKAEIEADELDDSMRARRTLRGYVAAEGKAYRPLFMLATLEESLGESAASSEILGILLDTPQHDNTLSRLDLLQWRGRLLDDAGDENAALAVFQKAAEEGRLSVDSERSRARIAERLESYEIAADALLNLLQAKDLDAEERVWTLGRLATAKEKSGDLEGAFVAWLERNERMPSDAVSLKALERIGRERGEIESAKAATLSLIDLEIDGEEAVAHRYVWLAQNYARVEKDFESALQAYAAARAIDDTAGRRAEMFQFAEVGGFGEQARQLLDDMEHAGDEMNASSFLRRGELRAQENELQTAALDDIQRAMDLDDALEPSSLLSSFSPQCLAEYLLAQHRDVTSDDAAALPRMHDLLRKVLGDEPALPNDVRIALQRALPNDYAYACHGALAFLENGLLEEATQVLVGFAGERKEDAEKQAVELLKLSEADEREMLATTGQRVWTAFASQLEGHIAADDEARSYAMVALRHDEEFEAIASLLESSIRLLGETADGDRRRTLRLELTAVCRTALLDAARAIPHLRSELERDPDDREVWGELLECLEEAEDEGLVDAVEARVARVEGIEKRELQRRAAELRVARGELGRAVDLIDEARRQHRDDPSLKAFARETYAQISDEDLAVFLRIELDEAPTLADAHELLSLKAASIDDRAHAGAWLINAGKGRDVANALWRESEISARLCSRLPKDDREGWFSCILQETHPGQDDEVLELYRALEVADVELTFRILGHDRLIRLHRSMGVAAAADFAQRWNQSNEDDRAAAYLWHASTRMGGGLRAHFGNEGANFELLRARAPEHRASGLEELHEYATTSLHSAASGWPGAYARLRTGETGAFEGLSEVDKGRAATRIHNLRATPERLDVRGLLAPFLDDEERGNAQLRSAEVAAESGRLERALECAEDALRLGKNDEALHRLYADVSVRADSKDAAERCADAADHQSDIDVATDYRRRALHLFVRSGDTHTRFEETLLSLVSDRSGDAEVLEEAMSIARATQKHRVIERLLAESVIHAANEAEQNVAIVAHAHYLRETLNDPSAAFSALMQSSSFSDDAYRLCVEDGLVEESLLVVDDELAQAGLLATLGRFHEALTLTASITHVSARWLELDLAKKMQVDLEAPLVALCSLDESSAEVFAELGRYHLQQDAPDLALEVLSRAVDRFGAHPAIVGELVDAIPKATNDAAVKESIKSLEELMKGAAEVPTPLIEVWIASAERLGDIESVVSGRLELAKRTESALHWQEYFACAFPVFSFDQRLNLVQEHQDKTSSWAPLVSAYPQEMEALLESVLAEHGTFVSTVLELSNHQAPHLLWRAYENEERFDAAARTRTQVAAESDAQMQLRAHQAAHLALKAGDVRFASACVLELPSTLYTSETRELIAAMPSGNDALFLWMKLAESSVGLLDDVERVLENAAAQNDPKRCGEVAVWRLKNAPEDVRAWHLARQVSEDCDAFFSSQLELRGNFKSAHRSPMLDQIQALRSASVDLPRPSADSFEHQPLMQARQGSAENRNIAWKILGDQYAERGEHTDAARLYARSGVSLADAPIEVRLAADPALKSPLARAKALASALSAKQASGEGTAKALFSALEELDARGYAGAEERRPLSASDVPQDGGGRYVDGFDLDGSGIIEIIRALGRRPSLSSGLRTTLAALAYREGFEEWAALLDPRLLNPRAETRTIEMGENELRVRLTRALERDASDEALGLQRTLLLWDGSSPDRELSIRKLAENSKRHDLIAESLGREALTSEDGQRSCSLLLRRARLSESALKRPDDALRSVKKALSFEPENTEATEAWVRLAAKSNNVEEHEEALIHQENLSATPQERARLVLVRARLHREERGEPSRALAAIDAALPMTGDVKELLAERAVILVALERPLDAAAAFVKAAALCETSDDDRWKLRRQGALLFAEAGDERAMGAYFMNAKEGDDEALIAGEEYARKCDDSSQLSDFLALRIQQHETGPARRLLVLEQSRLLAEELDHRGQALELLEDQIQRDPEDVGSRLALAHWRVEDEAFISAAELFEGVAFLAGTDAVRGTSAREAALLFSRLGELERAGPMANLAIETVHVERDVLSIATAFERSLDNHSRVDLLLEKQLDFVEGPAASAHVWMERAQIRAQHLGDTLAARQALYRALELNPEHLAAIDALRDDAQRHDSHGAYRAALMRAIDVTDDEARRTSWLLEMSKLDMEHFDDPKAALASAERALALAPERMDILVQCAEVSLALGHDDEVAAFAEMITDRAGTLPPSLRMIHAQRQASKGNVDAARAAFKAATLDVQTRALAFENWVALEEKEGSSETLIAVLNDGLAEPDISLELQKQWMHKAIALHQSNGASEEVFALSGKLLDLTPDDTEGLDAFRQAALSLGELDSFHRRSIAYCEAPDADALKAERHVEYGALLFGELEEPTRGFIAYERALELQPNDEQSLLRLAMVYTEKRMGKEALDKLDRVMPSSWPGGEIDLLFARADMAALIGSEDAEDRLRNVLRLDANHRQALPLLVDVCKRTGATETYEFALERWSTLLNADGDPRAAAVLIELTEIRRAAGRFDEALASLTEVLKSRPDDSALLQMSAELFEESAEFESAAKAYATLAPHKEGEQQDRIVLKEAQSWLRAGKDKEAADTFIEHHRRTQDESSREQAITLAKVNEWAHVYEHFGLDYGSIQREEDIEDLQRKIETSPATALLELQHRVSMFKDDDVYFELALVAADAAAEPESFVNLVEARASQLTNDEDVARLFFEAGKRARLIPDAQRAASLLFKAHQAEVENVEIRLALTSVYAELPELASAATTGVLQLLRRAPLDSRVYETAMAIPQIANNDSQRDNLAFVVAFINEGKFSLENVDSIPVKLSNSTLKSIAPSAFWEPLARVMAGLGHFFERQLIDNSAWVARADRIDPSSAAGAWCTQALATVDYPAAKIITADCDRIRFHRGASVVHIIIPESSLSRGEAVAVGAMSYALTLAKQGGILAHEWSEDGMSPLLHILETLLIDAEPSSAEFVTIQQRLQAAIPMAELQAAKAVTQIALQNGGQALANWRSAVLRCADRVCLLSNGSLAATLLAGPLPGVDRLDKDAALEAFRSSSRALDLLAFSVRGAVWEARERSKED